MEPTETITKTKAEIVTKAHEPQGDIMPNHTLYLNNINEKIKLDELKQTIYHLFTQFGDILEVNAQKRFRMKGQAFVVFRDINAATAAKNALDNATLFSKPLKIHFSKNTSDVMLKLSGKLSQKDKLRKQEDRKKRREEEYKELKKTAGRITAGQIKHERILPSHDPNKIAESMLSPNNILLVENLTSDINEPILRNVFGKYKGFQEVRLSSSKGVAFVEYDSEINAGGALLGLNNFHLSDNCVLQISFAKK